MTHVALLTPRGTGAIATIAVRGSDAWPIARRVFQRMGGKSLPEQPKAGGFWYGRVGGDKGDEVILAVRSTEPEVWTEYHCHGGKLVVDWLRKLFQEQDCVENGWEEFVSPCGDDSEKDKVALRYLPKVRTLRTASILLDQYHGAYKRAVWRALNALKKNDLSTAQSIIQELLRYANVGAHLTQPWRLAIAGLPNAGKSSLVNALAGYQRSVVAPIPGTTRDVVTTAVALAGWMAELSDTAGLRDSTDDLEKEGISRARRAMEDADLCLWVIDVTEHSGPHAPREEMLHAEREDHSGILAVLNKIDQPHSFDISRNPDAVKVSALTGAGIDELIRRIIALLVPDDPAPGIAVPYSLERILCLRRSQEQIRNGDIDSALTSLIHSTQSIG
jgi:tRNA modification GTPase